GHLLRGGQESQHIPFASWHDGDLGDVRSHILHLAQPVNDVGFCGRPVKVVVGSNHLCAGCVDGVDQFRDNLVSCEDLHIDQVRQLCDCHCLVQGNVRCSVHIVDAALLFCAEGEEERSFSQLFS